LKVTANQGFDTGGNGLFVRTLTMYIPIPSEVNLTTPFPMLNVTAQVGICLPFQITGVPFLVYQEILVDNPSLVNRCFTSYVPAGAMSNLNFNYFRGYPEISTSYTKGAINQGSLRATDFLGVVTEGAFSDVEWKLLFSFF
jgi:hypothetical protein